MNKTLVALSVVLFSIAVGSVPNAQAEIVVDFEDLGLSTSSFYNGNTGVTNDDGWSSGGAFFSNSYNSAFGGYWSGWSYSNIANATTTGPQNQYASFPGGGSTPSGAVDAQGTYAIGFGNGAFINLPDATIAKSLRLSNATYTAFAIRDGIDTNEGSPGFVTGAFGSKASISVPGYFASLDPDGNDFFRLTITGKDALDGLGSNTGSVTRYLADYRDVKSDNADASLYGGADYVLDQWLDVDLGLLGNARSLSIGFETTDIGTFGPNTPTYFAMDNLALLDASAVPEPTSLAVIIVAGAGFVWRKRNRPS